MSTPNTNDYHAAVAAIRETLTRLSDERHATERVPVTRAEAERRFEDLLASEAAAVGAGVDAARFTVPEYTPPERGVLALARPREIASGDPLPHLVGAVLARFNPEALRTAFREEANTFYAQHPEALSDDARTAKLAELDAEQLCTACDEERTIREAESAGVPIARRGDASPPAVLTPDEELTGDVPVARVDPARYWLIRDRATALADAMWGADERRRIARDEHQRAALRVRETEQTAASRGVEVSEDLRQFEAQRHTALERCTRTYDEIHEQWEVACRLASACREYATAQGVDVREPGAPGIEPGGLSLVSSPQWV